ncbi:hypothetical protein ACU8V3_17025 [Cobetia marina]
MLSHHYDRSRAIAVASQAMGLIAIVALETWLGMPPARGRGWCSP